MSAKVARQKGNIMDEYIERKLVIESIMNEDKDVIANYGEEYGVEFGFSEDKIIRIIMKVPAADVAPVVHGKWDMDLLNIFDDYTWICSACGNPWTLIVGTPKSNEMYYCPHCGAKMDSER